jgi:hypothetical protein
MGTPEEVIMPYGKIDIECYSRYKANERPVAFTYQKRRRKVAEIVDRWYEGGLEAQNPDESYFKVRTVEGEVFLLRYVSLFDAWSIVTPCLPLFHHLEGE